MTPELEVLTYALLLQFLQFFAVVVTSNIQLGVAKTLSPRDRDRLGGPLEEQLNTRNARLLRALNNHFEGLILFGLTVAVISLADKNTGFSAICAWVYLAARILYVPAYYFGLVPWRSLIWSAGFLATFAMLLSVFI